MKQPFRIEICKLLLDGKARVQSEIFEELRKAYNGERQIAALDDHLQSLRVVGLISVDKEWIEEQDGCEVLVQSWVISPSGRKRLEKVL